MLTETCCSRMTQHVSQSVNAQKVRKETRKVIVSHGKQNNDNNSKLLLDYYYMKAHNFMNSINSSKHFHIY